MRPVLISTQVVHEMWCSQEVTSMACCNPDLWTLDLRNLIRSSLGANEYTSSLEETSRVPSYHLAEGDQPDVQSLNIGIYAAWRKANDCIPSCGTPLKQRYSHPQLRSTSDRCVVLRTHNSFGNRSFRTSCAEHLTCTGHKLETFQAVTERTHVQAAQTTTLHRDYSCFHAPL